MSTRISSAASYPFPVSRVWAALSTQAYWEDRLAAVGGPGAQLRKAEFTEAVATIGLRQLIGVSELPAVAQKLVKDDLKIARTETWTLAGEAVTCEFTATVAGAPAKISGSARLVTAPGGSRTEFSGTAEVKVPLIGGKLEKAIVENIERLIAKEQEFTTAWIAKN